MADGVGATSVVGGKVDDAASTLPELACLGCEGGVVVWANAGAAELAGVADPVDLLGRSLATLLVEDEVGRWLMREDGTGVVPVRAGRVAGAAPGGQTAVVLVPERDAAGSGSPVDLPGRRAVRELLRQLLGGERAERVAVLLCDVDNFKRVNDSLGHDAGDELLAALGRRLEQGLPAGCTAARLSGDEYVVICRDVTAAGGLETLASTVAHVLRTTVPVQGQLLRVSASVGAATPCGNGPVDAETSGADLLRFADAAMFEAKRRGPGRVALANAALIASAGSQMYLEGQLRDALAGPPEASGLILHFQPVVGPDGTVLTAEALVRWQHPDRGLLAPSVFLPVAEQGDLLGELDRWVLRAALGAAARWPRRVAVAVNLAGLVPGDPDFVDEITAAVDAVGIAWHRVVLELVETSLADLPAPGLSAMAELVARGVRFAVDDFGTGYSSLARLKDLPAQVIKVDRRFVAGIDTDPSDFAVVRAVVDMALAMGRRCVAEGVETATQFRALRGLGVHAYQGWLMSQPVNAAAIRDLLELGTLRVPDN